MCKQRTRKRRIDVRATGRDRADRAHQLRGGRALQHVPSGADAEKSRDVTAVEFTGEVRSGGRYRYVLRKGNGPEIAFSGTYREVTPPTRVVYTNVYEAMAHLGESIVTVTFTERNGQTELVAHEVYPSAAARDAALASGMEHGMREAMDQLDALVASLR